jgi:hypothetical protein
LPKDQYQKLILISHQDHLQFLKNDPNALIISSDWLTWQRCSDAGFDCLHFESMMKEWPVERGDPDLHYLQSNNWMYINGQDISEFHGVSLGKQFNKEIALLSNAYLRHWHALDKICELYKPIKIELLDIRVEYDYLDNAAKKRLVEDISSIHGIQFEDRDIRRSPDTEAYHDLPFSAQAQEKKGIKYWLRQLYENLIDPIFRTRFLSAPAKPRVFLLLNWGTMNSLIEHFHSYHLSPVILAGQWPKTISFVSTCLRKGIFLTKLPRVDLSQSENAELKQMIATLEAAWTTADTESSFEITRREFFKNQLIASGVFHQRALEIKQYELLFRRHKFSQIVVGDAENRTCRLLMELASRYKIPANELLNGMFMTGQQFDARSGDDYHSGYLTRLLSWGEQNETWLQAKNKNIPFTRVGNPALDILKPSKLIPSTGKSKALVLPMSMEGVKALNSSMFSTLVDTVTKLKENGYSEIRVKVHVGHPVKKYFDAIVEYFDLDCEIFQNGGLMEHIKWADFVIGPINSGAFVETMILGKPYYPMCVPPTSIRRDFLGDIEPIETVPELLEAISKNKYPYAEKYLEYFCSASSLPNAAKQVWKALEESKDLTV